MRLVAPPLVMGVLNVTPDSFSDGGRYLEPDAAVARGVQMIAEGADVIDVGGASTRPGSQPPPAAEELRRVVPVIEALAAHGGARISVDTFDASVAIAAVAAGATLINDVSASLWMVAADAGVGWVAMHKQGPPSTMQDAPHYDDVIGEVAAFLQNRLDVATAAGVREVWVDPGIGFGKTVDHNLALLAHLDALAALGPRLVVGLSRKHFLGVLTQRAEAAVPDPNDRLEASLAGAVWAALHGAAMIRVHDVTATVAAVRILGDGVAAR